MGPGRLALRLVRFLSVFLSALCVFIQPVHGAVTIGALWDLSGPGADEGNASLRAVREAVRIINNRGGVKGQHLELAVADTQGQKGQLLVQASKMIKNPGIIALIGPTSPGLARILQTLAESYDIPVVLTSGQTPLLPSRGGLPVNWTFCSNPRLDIWGRALLHGLSRANLRMVGPLVVDSRWGKEVALWLRAYGPEMGVRILPVQSYQVEDADVVAQLNWFKEQGADVVVAWGPRDWTHILIKSALHTGMPVAIPSHLLTSLASSVLAAKVGLLMVAPPVIMGYELPPSHPCAYEVNRFVNAMEGLLSPGLPQELLSAGAAWDAVHLIVNALSNAESTDRAGLRDALEGIEEPFNGVMGVFKPDARNHCGILPSSQLVLRRGETGWIPLKRRVR